MHYKYEYQVLVLVLHTLLVSTIIRSINILVHCILKYNTCGTLLLFNIMANINTVVLAQKKETLVSL